MTKSQAMSNGPIHNLDKSIAVIGYSCRLPGANSGDEFWEVLEKGQDCIISRPDDRPVAPRKGDDNLRQTTGRMAGFLKCRIDEFDAKFFGISPREAIFVDPQQRLLLEVTWEALEDAGVDPHGLKSSDTGVFVGIWQQDYDHMLPCSDISPHDLHHRYLGNALSGTASRISFFLGLNGPNYVIESGCSSSLGALHLACEGLLRGESALSIASGVNLVLNPMTQAVTNEDNISQVVLSRIQRCQTFDADADGFVRAEGCGALVLKRYVDAIRDNDSIHAIIRGCAVTNDGAGTSFGTPNAFAQEICIRNALKNADVQPHEVSYVEAHGTGTAVGDPTEVYAIGKVYSENRTKPLYISSVKTNIGHAESFAGLAGFVKVMLCIKRKAIPPHLHLKTLNPRIDLESIPAIIPLQVTSWDGEPRIAGLSSFGMTGTNVHVILQEPEPIGPTVVNDEPKMQLIQLSAKTENAVESLVSKYVQFLRTNPDLSLEQIAFGTNKCRAHHKYRIAVSAKSNSELFGRLEKRSYGTVQKTIEGKVGFVFTGQGSQYVGMGGTLCSKFPAFRQAIEECDKLFKEVLHQSLFSVLREDKLLEKTIYCQPAIFCIEYSLLKLWQFFEIVPDVVLGHSVGEFAAGVAAGFLSLKDAFALVAERSRLVENTPQGSMLVLRCSLEEAESAIEAYKTAHCTNGFNPLWIDIAAINSTEEVVVSGKVETISSFTEHCETVGLKVQLISASHAFHSRAMDSIADEFGSFTERIKIGTPTNTSYVSGTLAKLMTSDDFTPDYWQRHLRESVQFSAALKEVYNLGARVFVEVGPQPILLGLAIGNLGRDSGTCAFCPSMRKNEDEEITLFSSLGKLYVAGIEADWTAWFGRQSKAIAQQLPKYPFQMQRYWYPLDEDDENMAIPHPFLGVQLQYPIGQTIYQSKVKSTPYILNYVLDHQVAGRVILPASAYLELIMAAGLQTLNGSGLKVAITVENMRVEAALDLEKTAQLLTVVESGNDPDGVKYTVAIHRNIKRGKWKRQAVAELSAAVNVTEEKPFDIEQTQSRLVPIKEEVIPKVYAKLYEAGIQFGPKFQSIGRAWNRKSDESNPNEILTQITLPTGSERYICHPVVSDAMIQTYAFKMALQANIDDVSVELQLPIGIKKFTWFTNDLTPTLYAYTSWNIIGEEHGVVFLYNEHGVLLAQMEGLALVQTSMDSFLRAIRAEHSDLPNFMHEVWRPTLSIKDSNVMLDLFVKENFLVRPGVMEKVWAQEGNILVAMLRLGEACTIAVLRSFFEIHKSLGVETPINLEQVWSAMPVQFQQKKFINYSMEALRHNGYALQQDGKWVLTDSLTSSEAATARINQLFREAIDYIGVDTAEVQFAKRMVNNYAAILKGEMSPLELHFPENPAEYGAQRFYSDASYCALGIVAAVDMVCTAAATIPTKGKQKIRILEVGGGTAAITVPILRKLVEMNVVFDYTFTDISKLFVAEAKKRLSEEFPNTHFEILNLEEDPLAQNFTPETYDLVIGMQVLHATRDLRETFVHINSLMRTPSVLFFIEQFEDVPLISHSFGLLEGYWRYTDDRTLSPSCSIAGWKSRVEDTGFKFLEVACMLEGTVGAMSCRKVKYTPALRCHLTEVYSATWVVVSDQSQLAHDLVEKLEFYGRTVRVFNLGDENLGSVFNSEFEKINTTSSLEGVLYFVSETHETHNPETVSLTLLQLIQNLLANLPITKSKPRFCAVTRGVNYIKDSHTGNPTGGLVWGITKSFGNEMPEITTLIVDLDMIPQHDIEVSEVFSALWTVRKDSEMYISIQNGHKYLQRFANLEKTKHAILMPTSARYTFVKPATKIFPDIQYGPAEKILPTADNVEVSVRAVALNFRDIFVVLKPEGFPFTIDMPMEVGLDIAGVITAVGPDVKELTVGEEVIGMTLHGGLRSHVILPEHTMVTKPKGMTFNGASTLPCAFLTAYYSLCDIAKMTKEDRVLIHVASGGVGLAAVQIVQHTGAEIFATAGTNRKRAYLRSLGIKHVYHSRNTEFGDEIERDTVGAGVTIVLNSLTGPGFKEASLRVCAQGARFLEIGKLNIWEVEEVKALRPDVEYTLIDLTKVGSEDQERMRTMWKNVKEQIQNRNVRALPHTTFPLELSPLAFYFLQEARHIGKVVIQLPTPIVDPVNGLSWHHNLFDSQSTYLITGGLGGLGMEVAKWMTTMGAVHIILAGRSPPTELAQSLIASWNSNGAKIETKQVDVSSRKQCADLVDLVHKEYPPLRGIFNCAGIISDALMQNQTPESYRAVLGAKVSGAWNFHTLTATDELEFFVMFSSAVGNIGSPGQSNHSAANRYLDSLAHYRISKGLPATTINWGPWSDVGAAAHIKLGQEAALGIRAFTPKQGIASLEYIMRHHIVQASVLDVSDWSLVKQFVKAGNFLAEVSHTTQIEEMNPKRAEELRKMLLEIKNSEPEGRQEKIENYLEMLIKETLKLPINEKVDHDMSFTELGIDSLMAMEMRNRLDGVLEGKTLTLSALQENRTIRSLSTHINKVLSEENAGQGQTVDTYLQKLDEHSLNQKMDDVKNEQLSDLLQAKQAMCG